MSGPQKPNPGQKEATLSEAELAHLSASVFAAGFMSAMSTQLPTGSLDPTFQSAGSQNLLLAGIGAYKAYYAFLMNALKDPTWAEPSLPVPSTPVSSTTTATAATATTATALPALLQAIIQKPAGS